MAHLGPSGIVVERELEIIEFGFACCRQQGVNQIALWSAATSN